jgi:hypothetical protein
MSVSETTRTLAGVACGAVIDGEPVVLVAATEAGAAAAATALGIRFDRKQFVPIAVQLPRS